MALLKTPEGLADAWFNAMIKGRAPMSWQLVKTKYWNALNAVAGQPELLQVQSHHLLDWCGALFGNKPLDAGKSITECWNSLRAANKGINPSVD